jgi:hypothetical protein
MTQKTLTLPLMWVKTGNDFDDTKLMLGSLDIGATMFMPKPGVWCALGSVLTSHRSTGHTTREAAQAALEDAVMALDAAGGRVDG